ncbi:glycine cleavage T C-terminal barrel domain-containing protein [Thermocatellispora tengchongensis]|uniref:glycine cleavage T C-terminal barrel domain-containing protein n=1 Tax=Thermocatellispora tengchongensis TaxID=1073253 RepID=UPI00362A6963
MALGNEPVRVGDTVVGRVTSGGYGYTVDASIAYAYLPAEHADPGTKITIDLFGARATGTVTPEPLFDPTSARVRTL